MYLDGGDNFSFADPEEIAVLNSNAETADALQAFVAWGQEPVEPTRADLAATVSPRLWPAADEFVELELEEGGGLVATGNTTIVAGYTEVPPSCFDN